MPVAEDSPQHALVGAVGRALDSIRAGLETETLQLPLLSPLASRANSLRDVLRQSNPLEPSRVLEVLEADPTAAARILRLASPPGGPDGPARSLTVAIARLGLVQVLHALDELASATPASPEGCERTLRKIWTNTIFTAHAARILAEWVKHPDPDGVYLAALFHNLGEPLLVEALGQSEHAAALLNPQNLHGLTRQHHGRVGQAVLSHWGLPADFATLAARHHEPVATELHALVTAGHEAALQYGYTYLDNTYSPGRLAAALDILGLHRTRLQAIAPRIGDRLNAALTIR
jgi:HD-like signal output (HDOD) protein